MKNKNKIAVLGPEGTFTESAAKKMFGESEIIYCDNVRRVFEEVEGGADYGVIAIENSIEGSVNTTEDNLLEHDLKIVKEVIIDINLCLIALPKTGKKDIRTIISHPHALAQCEKYIRDNLPNARVMSYDSTTAAIKEIKESNLENTAAIGPKDAAKRYKLNILEEGIQDAMSQTRFIAVSQKESDGKKTSVIFSLKDRPGSLYDVLKDFAEARLNLTKIESRPSKKKLGEYLFYIDFIGSLKDDKVKKVLNKVEEKTTYLKLLGSY
jgi:prephenate dehydratase